MYPWKISLYRLYNASISLKFELWILKFMIWFSPLPPSNTKVIIMLKLQSSKFKAQTSKIKTSKIKINRPSLYILKNAVFGVYPMFTQSPQLTDAQAVTKSFLHCFFHKIAFMSRRISSTFPDKASTNSDETVNHPLVKVN